MVEDTNSLGLDGSTEKGDGVPWRDTVDLLRFVQNDFQGTRKQLEQLSSTLAEREALVGQRLQYALQQAQGYRSLCLIPYGTGWRR